MNLKKKGLSSAQKKVLIAAGVAAIAAGGYLAYRHYSGSAPAPFKPFDLDELRNAPGKKISIKDYSAAVTRSKDATWSTAQHMDMPTVMRSEQTFPAGHTFHRLSQVAETKFSPVTYSTSNAQDFGRYTSHFKQELVGKVHHVQFTAKTPLKVPSTTTALDSLKEVIRKNEGVDPSPERVMRTYNSLHGSDWNDKTALGFISNLRSKGYGALVDELDAGVVGESPLIVFGKNVTSKVSRPLSSDVVKAAEEGLREITNRKL